jgi:hypothetical protein
MLARPNQHGFDMFNIIINIINIIIFIIINIIINKYEKKYYYYWKNLNLIWRVKLKILIFFLKKAKIKKYKKYNDWIEKYRESDILV